MNRIFIFQDTYPVIMYDPFSKYIRKYDQISTDTIFSARDSRKYAGKEIKKKSNFILPLGCGVIMVLLPYLVIRFNIIPKILTFAAAHLEFKTEFITTGASILASLLAISLTVLFFYYESNSKKYIFLDFKYFLRHKIISSLLILYVLTLVLSLSTLIFNLLIILIITTLLIFISLISLPFFILTCQKIVDRIYVVEKLERDLFKAIKEKQVSSVENILQNFEFLLINSIEIRDKILIKNCIDKLHDISKFYVSTDWKFKHEHLETVFAKDKMNLHSDWFLDEIFNSLESAYILTVDKNMLNFSNYIMRAINSIGTKSLNYKDNLHETKIILKTYKKIILYSLKKNDFDFKDQFTIRHYLEMFIKLKDREFAFSMESFFSEDFVIELLKSKPHMLTNFLVTLFGELKNVGSIIKPNEDNALEIARIAYNIHFISKKLEELNELEGKILFENNKLRERLSDIIILSGLVLLFYNKKELAKKCKKVYTKDKVINEKEVFLRLANNTTIFMDAKDFFKGYNTDGNEKHFDEKKYNKILKEYKELTD